MEGTNIKHKVGVGAYIALLFAAIFFSGIVTQDWFKKGVADAFSDKQEAATWVKRVSVLDFNVLNGAFGKLLDSVKVTPEGTVAMKDGKPDTHYSEFRGKGGNGAKEGFLFALGLIPTVMFALAMISVLEHYGALEAARKLLTPLLRRLMGIPGSTGLALIGSLQSTDAGASMTRALADEGVISEKEKDIFTMFQFSAGAMITNFLSTGAVFFTLMLANGERAVPTSIGMCLVVMFVMKIFGANLMRLYWQWVEKKDAAAEAKNKG